MSDKRKFPRDEAWKVAAQLHGMLSAACTRIAIAGSVRRCKATVGDVELLYVPKIAPVKPADPFAAAFDGARGEDLAAFVIETFLTAGILTKRHNSLGHPGWGPKNKFGLHEDTGIPVDLFATTEANWWVSLVIRTGGTETNLRLTNGARKLGRTLNAYGYGVTDLRTGEVTPATSEEHVFELCGVAYLPPERRT